MTKQNNLKNFWMNGKKYPHFSKHLPNARQVCLDVYVAGLKKRGLKIECKEQIFAFSTGFNMGYREGKNRNKEIK